MQKAILGTTEEIGELDMIRKIKQSSDDKIMPRNPTTSPCKDADGTVPHMSLADAQHSERTSKNVGCSNHFKRAGQSFSRLTTKESDRERRAVSEMCQSSNEVETLRKKAMQ